MRSLDHPHGPLLLVLQLSSAGHHSRQHALLIQAMQDATVWMSNPANWNDVAEIAASKKYVNTPISMVEACLLEHPINGQPSLNPGGTRLFGENVNLPIKSHATWYLDQMKLWGHCKAKTAENLDLGKICLESFFRQSTHQ